MTKFAELFKQARIDAGLTQEEVARNLFVDPKTVSAWECGRINPEPSKWDDICKFMHITTAQLYEALFDEDQYLYIPHFVSEKWYRAWYKDDGWFADDKTIDAMVKVHQHDPEAPEGMCWDYCLMLTRPELEVCLYYMKAFPELDFFETYHRFVEPAIDASCRRSAQKGGGTR